MQLVASVVSTSNTQPVSSPWFFVDTQAVTCRTCTTKFLQNITTSSAGASTLSSMDALLTGLLVGNQVPVSSATWTVTATAGPSAGSAAVSGNSSVTTAVSQYSFTMRGLAFVPGDALTVTFRLALASGVVSSPVTGTVAVSVSERVARGAVVNNGGAGGCGT